MTEATKKKTIHRSVMFEVDVDIAIRKHCFEQGDFSKFVNEGAKLWLKQEPKDVEV